MKIDEKWACSVIIESLGRLYRNDQNLFDYNGKNYERALAFRVAHYLANIIENDKELESDICVDNEYERHIENPKFCFTGCGGCNRYEENKCFVQENREKISLTENEAKIWIFVKGEKKKPIIVPFDNH